MSRFSRLFIAMPSDDLVEHTRRSPRMLLAGIATLGLILTGIGCGESQPDDDAEQPIDDAQVVANPGEALTELVQDADSPDRLTKELAADTELAKRYFEQAEWDKAETLMTRNLERAEKLHGLDSPETATALNNLAQLLKATNRLAEAEPLMRRALEILILFGKATGHEHPHFRLFRQNYTLILGKLQLPLAEFQQRFQAVAEASGPLKSILPDIERVLGPTESVADVLAALDEQYRKEGKPAIYFLKPDKPISPHLDALLGPANPE